ncbi:MAG: class I SAM-dependent methyltransferase, partial [Syntrophaceae bacterium]
MSNWIYDEFKHCGVDYSKDKEAEIYDERHQKFRSYENEFNEMLNFLDIQDATDKIIVDLGCGTGA